MRTIYRTIVAALIFSADRKLFQGKSAPHHGAVYGDAWRIPGGGVEEGETNEEALIREIDEEIGLDIRNAPIKQIGGVRHGQSEKTLASGERVHCIMEFYTYEVQLGQEADAVRIKTTDEIAEYEWVLPSELEGRNVTPPSRELFKALGYIR